MPHNSSAPPDRPAASTRNGVGSDADAPLVLYDGVCTFCNASVNWILRRDRRARFRFAALKSEAGRAALANAGFTEHGPNSAPDSVVLIQRGRAAVRSEAALGIARLLGWPWSLAAIFLLIPRALRDGVYNVIARHRYAWFGRHDRCVRPAADVRARFLDADEPVPDLKPPDAHGQ